MAYVALARRYRSRSFDDLIGQEPIARTLKNAIDSNPVAHATSHGCTCISRAGTATVIPFSGSKKRPIAFGNSFW